MAKYPVTFGYLFNQNELCEYYSSSLHEAYETFTDPSPYTGWAETSSFNEVADLCEYVGLYSIQLSNGKKYPAQGLWDNNIGCIAGTDAEFIFEFTSKF